MKLLYTLLLFSFVNLLLSCDEPQKETYYPSSAIRMSQDFILAIKTDQAYEAYRDTLSRINLDQLSDELNTSARKHAFWINTYNALVQAKIKDDVKQFDDKDKFFGQKDQILGGVNLSLDQIENGILRRKKISEQNELIDQFKVDQLDPRIHFTLNCGATSCPPVAYYSEENLDMELRLAEESFVTQTSSYDEVNNTVEISELFKWFESDFAGRSGVISLLERLEIIPVNSNPIISYTPYNWNLDLNNY